MYNSITEILESAGQTDLLAYMREYWLPDRGSAEHFWEHEWRKHGTCMNTLAPACYGEGYTDGDEVVDFFTRAVEIFKVCFILLFDSVYLKQSGVYTQLLVMGQG